MKKIFVLILLWIFISQEGSGQTRAVRQKNFGISLILNDFVTPQLIRSSSLSKVIREENFGKISKMDPGIAITYINGFAPHIDFTATLGGSMVKLPLTGKTFTDDHLLLEADASANFKMFAEEETRVNPYLIAGIGASHYKNIYGAFIPLGGGIKVKVVKQTQAFVHLQYRVPVTPDANNYHMQLSIGVSGLFSRSK